MGKAARSSTASNSAESSEAERALRPPVREKPTEKPAQRGASEDRHGRRGEPTVSGWGTRIAAVAIAIAVVGSALAVAAPGIVATALEADSAPSEAESAQPTPIDSCTVISESGHYVLADDIVRSDRGDDACIEVRASDVVLRGDGRTIDGGGYGTGIAVGGQTPVRNVSVANLTVRESVYNVRFDGATHARLANVTSREPDPTGGGVVVADSRQIAIQNSDLRAGGIAGAAVKLDSSERITVRNNSFVRGARAIEAVETNRSAVIGNHFTDVRYAIDVESGSDTVISQNAIEGRPQLGIGVGGSNNTVIDNTVELAYNGIGVSGSENTIANNDVSRIEEWAASVRGTDHTITHNSFSGGERTTGGALTLAGADHAVTANRLEGAHGVSITDAKGQISIRNNRLGGGNQLRVSEMCDDSSGASHVEVSGNAFTTDGPEQSPSVMNEDDEVLPATDNYWGDESGPSSPGNETVTDPITGTVADGDGVSVSDGIHFDPWLRNQPSN